MMRRITLKYIQVNFWCRRSVVGVFVLAVMLLAAGNCLADYTALKMFPENVGVFTTDGQQQFIVLGQTATGWTNITGKVDWKSSNDDIVTIDATGMARIVAGRTFGQVKISCSYPKESAVNTGTNLLLLSK